MIKVIDILNRLDERFPMTDAGDFDNVGLLVGDKESAVTGVLVALDCTLPAIEKAADIGANLIVTHHPVIFEPLRSVTADSVVFELIKNGISVISMHTNFDIGKGGVNDILCDVLGLSGSRKYTANDGYILNLAEMPAVSPAALADSFKARLGFPVRFVTGRPIRRLLVCSGSGGSYIGDAISGGFDALVTADVKHDRFIAAQNAGISLFDCGHFATENICVKPLAKMISADFPDLEISPFEPEIILFN